MKLQKRISVLLSRVCGLAFGVRAAELVTNGDFEDGLANWSPVPNVTFEEQGGAEGSKGILYTLEEGSPERRPLTQELVQVPEAGALYRLAAHIRSENIKGGRPRFRVDYYDADGNHLGFDFKRGLAGTADWRGWEINCVPPEGVARAVMALDMEEDITSGKAWFDHISFSKVVYAPQVCVVYPTQGQLSADGDLVKVNLVQLGNDEGEGIYLGQRLRLEAVYGDERIAQEQTVASHLVNFQMPALPPGPVELITTLIRASDGEVLATATEHFTAVASEAPRPRGACYIDEKGRAIVDGKPFLPIGMYITNFKWPNGQEEFDRLLNSPFNCFMPYDALQMHRPDDEARAPSFESLRAMLDAVDEHGKKVIFSVKDMYDAPGYEGAVGMWRWMGEDYLNANAALEKLVGEIGSHPAILAWYINDEISIRKLAMVQARREQLNRLDPNHPTWGTLCDYSEAPFFACAQDVMGVDPYPLEYKTTPANQAKLVTAMNAVDASGQPAWVVPQVMNWAVYRAREKPERWNELYEPTLEQMRAMTLYDTLRGAKGFVSYSYQDLWRPMVPSYFNPPMMTKEECERRWNECCQIAETLQELAPFLLSDQGPQPVSFQVLQGRADARLFQDEAGRIRIIVAAIGPGPAEVVVRPPAGKSFTSAFGHATLQEDGAWRFTADGIAADILCAD